MSSCLIDCTGKDYKIHVTYPWSDAALCGEGIRSKKVGYCKYTTSFWCGYCSSLADELEEINND